MIDLTIIVPSLSHIPNKFGEPDEDTKKMKNAEKECFISLEETVPNEIPIIVASNGGDPFPLPIELEVYNRNWKRIHLWEQGQCKAVNAAVATVDTEWIMVTNNDMVYPPIWLDLVGTMIESEHENISCVSPILVEPQQGAPTFIVKPFGSAGGDFRKSDWLEFTEEYNPEPTYPRTRTGFNLPFIIRKELWDMIGGYDINYDPWGSNGDSDLEYKIKLAGFQPKQDKEWIVYHFSQTSGTFHPSKQEWWNKNFAYFEEKWGFPRTDEGIWEANFEIPYEKLKYKPKWAKIPG